jgi:hypothetical protein
VPIILGVDRAAEYAGPERAFGGQVSGVEYDDLMVDFHSVILAPCRAVAAVG